MELLSMERISPEGIKYLRNNINPGIEFEYALFYLLLNERHKSQFSREIIHFHPFKERILLIINSLDNENLIKCLKTYGYTECQIFIATQVDGVGPADVLLKNHTSELLGLSVKYQNNCTFNISGKNFLSKETIKLLKDKLSESCKKYIDEMVSNYGATENWFRKRRTSDETDRFIDTIRDKVIEDWNNKSCIEKKTLLERLIHADSPINYWVVKFILSRKKFRLEVNTEPIRISDPENVTLTKEATSLVGFKCDEKLFAKMQVKFNNGILEKDKNNKYDYQLEENINIKYGDPFGSWNFSICE